MGSTIQEQKDAIRLGSKDKKRTPEQSAYLSSIRKGRTRGPCPFEKAEKIRQTNLATKQRQREEMGDDAHTKAAYKRALTTKVRRQIRRGVFDPSKRTMAELYLLPDSLLDDA